MRAVAVDWSGRQVDAARHIWLAECQSGHLTRLEADRNRDALGDELVRMAGAEPDFVVGLDFAFSFPLWFLDAQGVETGMEVDAGRAEEWLRECPPPFWGRRGRRRGPEPQLRLTERELAGRLHVRPKSIFQISGAGSVGTASLRGLPLLARLRARGFSIWPFDPPRLPVAIEIYPRLFTPGTVKSNAAAREGFLAARGWPLEAARTEDGFDAAVSALSMEPALRRSGLPRDELDPVRRREGAIWSPEDVSRR